MSEERWELDIAPTAPEVYEAMIVAGRATLHGWDRVMQVFQSLFIGFCAPMGATMLFWIIVSVSGGPEFAELPSAAIPVTYVLFGMLTLWLMRQANFKIARLTVRSRFGSSQKVLLDHSGVAVIAAHSRWQSGWEDVALVRGGKKVLVIGISGIVIPVPRRAFLGPKDANDALSVMQKWLEAAQ